jgi:hypothetical protein
LFRKLVGAAIAVTETKVLARAMHVNAPAQGLALLITMVCLRLALEALFMSRTASRPPA